MGEAPPKSLCVGACEWRGNAGKVPDADCKHHTAQPPYLESYLVRELIEVAAVLAFVAPA